MRRSLGAALVVATLVLAGCAGSPVETRLGTVGEGPDIAAADLTFDRAELEVPADTPVDLVFDNQESAPHNIAIYTDESGAEALFVGEIFGGPASRRYGLPALAPGSYVFRCDVHQDMKGTLVATP